ncbi:dihydroorotase [Neofusicoccum ribis]|uniref:Dihydroorotase n=1 Tax=Neofusicoccum ribis TaxID=45134 RepID=A0ABR3T8J3_9PEZI
MANFSTHASLRAPVLSRPRNPLLGVRSPLNTPALRIPFTLGSTASAIRFASTSPAVATASVLEDAKATATDAATSAPLDAASASVSGVTDDFLNNIANMPEQIGYLKAIGLDYGWGPTACIEWLLEHIHIWMGIPWWAAIVVTAVAVRASLFPLFATTSDVTARQQALKDITDPLNRKMNEARIAGSTDLMMQARAELMAVYKQAGINAWKAFYAPVTQAVTGYCSWKLLRAMAALPVPGLETGGFLWLKDLTVADPFFIMPIAFGALIHLVSKAGGETGAMKQLSSLQRKFLLYILPGVAVIFTIAQPAAVQLSFFTASSLGMLQARILRNTAVRELLGLAPFVDQPGAQNQYPNIIDTTARVTSPGQLKWEPPTVQSSIAHAGKINEATVEKSPLDQLKKSYMETRKELTDFKDGIMKRAGFYQDNTQGRKQTKEFLKRANDYEARRRAEQELEREAKRGRGRS